MTCTGCRKEITGYPCVFCGWKAIAELGAGAQAFGVIVLLSILGGCWYLVFGTGDSSESQATRDRWAIVSACESSVRAQLRAPRSARFEGRLGDKVAVSGRLGPVEWLRGRAERLRCGDPDPMDVRGPGSMG